MIPDSGLLFGATLYVSNKQKTVISCCF